MHFLHQEDTIIHCNVCSCDTVILVLKWALKERRAKVNFNGDFKVDFMRGFQLGLHRGHQRLEVGGAMLCRVLSKL